MADSLRPVDSLTQPPEPPKQTPAAPVAPAPAASAKGGEVKRLERMLLLGGSGLYIVYLLWAFILMAILPSTSEAMKPLVSIGLLSAAVAGLVFLALGGLLLMHISQSKTVIDIRKRALIRLAIFVVPGLLISGVMAFMISREPPLSLEILSPAASKDWVAPVAMNFSVEKTVGLLAQRGFRPVTYKWDINGDRKVDQETLVPTLTATYDREGVYTMTVSMVASDGSIRAASKRFIILTSVFGVSPAVPIVEQPVIFSLAGLITDPAAITQVQWDFDGDNKVDATTASATTTYTYFKTGDYTVSALIDLANKTQARYQRSITVQDPPVLPFPVSLKNEPANLISSAPFTVLFTIDTKEKIADVQWQFGDGQTGAGNRVAHTYTSNGSYPVVANVRSASGVIATLTTAVQIVDELTLADLTFEGSPKPQGDTIQGEVPLTISLTPKTSTSFVQFNWETPEATEVGSTKTKLQAIYRRVGEYTLTLVAQDLNNHVLRRTFNVSVREPSALVSVRLNPETGLAPLTVNFDASETSVPGDDVTGFIWNFGDGTPEITQGANVSHTYTIPKTYTVGLTVQTANGKAYRTTATVVVRSPGLLACMTRSKETITAGSSVQFFSDCSTGTAQSYLWDFGDNAQSTEANPVHLYTEPGTYTVKLTVGDGTTLRNTATSTITVQP